MNYYNLDTCTTRSRYKLEQWIWKISNYRCKRYSLYKNTIAMLCMSVQDNEIDSQVEEMYIDNKTILKLLKGFLKLLPQS